ncbi:MAG TPA: DUF2000 domain-containing protein [Holophaga sp.]|nr:DUF2000 domain-containing protein [Holophaga sp.]HPS66525.1 DUF2000 domain-containing protein [Holophaga sp.]
MKIVIVLDRNLPAGVLANAAAVLAFSSARHLPQGVGQDLLDADGGLHPGITNLPIPVLACEGERLADLRRQALESPGVGCVDFSEAAQRARRYEDYEARLKVSREGDLRYLGLCLFGESTRVKRLTGNLPLAG